MSQKEMLTIKQNLIGTRKGEESHRPGGSPYPLDVIAWCALPFSPLAGLKRQPEHFLTNDSGEARFGASIFLPMRCLSNFGTISCAHGIRMGITLPGQC